jgi:hypothetical protein
VTDEKEVLCDLHAPRKPAGPITVHVVDSSNPPRPVPHAQVVGVSISSMNHADLEATTNDEGWFRVDRALDKMIVYANSKDHKLAGSLTITPDDREITISLFPAGSAKGQLIDAPTGKVLPNRPVHFQVFYRYELPNISGMSSSRVAASTKTDAEGRFEITGLTPGQTYQMSAPVRSETDPVQDQMAASLGSMTARSGETIDVGIVKFRGDMTPDETMAVALANRDPVDLRMVDLANEGKKTGKRRLLMFWTYEANKLLEDVTKNDFQKRFADYYVLSCCGERTHFEAARVTFSRKWNFTPSEQPWPIFCILADDGKTAVVKNTQEFTVNGKVDDRLVIAFLRQNARRQTADKTKDASKPVDRKDKS